MVFVPLAVAITTSVSKSCIRDFIKKKNLKVSAYTDNIMPVSSMTNISKNMQVINTLIDENIFSKSLAKALESTFVFVAPISISAEAIASYSSVAIDSKNTSIAAHVFGDIRPTIPDLDLSLSHNGREIELFHLKLKF